MQLTINRKLFESELSLLSSIASKQDTIISLQGVLIEATSKSRTAVLTSTDLTVTLRSEIDAEVIEVGSALLRVRQLTDMVKRLDGETVTLTSIENDRIELSCGPSVFKVPLLIAEFPALPEPDGEVVGTIQSTDFAGMIGRVVFAIPPTPTQLVLNGALLSLGEEACWLVATDGHRLTYVKMSGEGASEKQVDLLLPLRTINALHGLLTGVDPTIISVMRGDRHFYFHIGRRLFSSLQLAGSFPDCKKAILDHLTKPDRTATMDRKRLIQALRRVALITATKEKELTEGVDLDFGASELRLNAASHVLGEVNESMSISYKGEPLQTRLDSRFLLEFLNVAGSDNVRLAYGSPLAKVVPLLWTSDSDAFEYQCVITPMIRNGPPPEPEPPKPKARRARKEKA